MSPRTVLSVAVVGFTLASLAVTGCRSDSNTSSGDDTAGSGGSGSGGSAGANAGRGGGSGAGGSSGSGGSVGSGGNAGGMGGASGMAGSTAGATAGASGNAAGAGGKSTAGAGGSAGSGGSTTDAGARDTAPPATDTAAPVSGVFVAVGANGVVIRSVDGGKTWQDGGAIPEAHALDNLAWGKGLFFGGTHNNLIYTSADGLAWTVVAKPLGQWVGGVAYGNDLFVEVGGYGSSGYSADAKTWTDGTFRDGDAARGLAFGGGTFTANTDSGTWWTSTDGKNWVKGTGGHTGRVVYCETAFTDASKCNKPMGRGQSAAFGAGAWVAVVNGAIQRSTDSGQNWSTIAGTSKNLNAVAFAPN